MLRGPSFLHSLQLHYQQASDLHHFLHLPKLSCAVASTKGCEPTEEQDEEQHEKKVELIYKIVVSEHKQGTTGTLQAQQSTGLETRHFRDV